MLLASTAFALLAALLVVVVAGRVDSKGSDASSGTNPDLSLQPTPTNVAKSTPAVQLASLTGKPTTSLGAQLGRTPVVVNFFSSWCTPCISEMPAFQRVHQDLGGKVAIVGVAYNDTTKNALATVAKTKVTYPTYADVDGAALSYFGGIEMPTTVFMDRTGKVLDVNNGAMSEKELRSKLADLYGISA